MNQKQIFELIAKFDESSLSALEIETEGFRIALKNDSSAAAQTATPMAVPMAAHRDVPQEPRAAESQEASESGTASAQTEIITSPIVGTFYRSPAQDAHAFVEAGSAVVSGDALCIIEAMKIMNKLEAEFACEIVKILAENGQMVEYGAPLFEVKRA